MLYLIDPRGAVWSADVTLGRAIARQKVDGRPIDDLPFRKAPMVLAQEDFEDLALRHGVAGTRGILLDSSWVDQVLAPSRLHGQKANQEATAEQLAPVELNTEDDELAEFSRAKAYMAGRKDLDARIEKAEKAAREALQAPPRRELLQLWRVMGGQYPATIAADLDDAR